jgi:hypothetical protein
MSLGASRTTPLGACSCSRVAATNSRTRGVHNDPWNASPGRSIVAGSPQPEWTSRALFPRWGRSCTASWRKHSHARPAEDLSARGSDDRAILFPRREGRCAGRAAKIVRSTSSSYPRARALATSASSTCELTSPCHRCSPGSPHTRNTRRTHGSRRLADRWTIRGGEGLTRRSPCRRL